MLSVLIDRKQAPTRAATLPSRLDVHRPTRFHGDNAKKFLRKIT
jgi:hypothetical protein